MTDIDKELEVHAPYDEGKWRDHAACKGMDLNLFFPARGAMLSKEVEDACGRCPVREKCLDYAIRAPIIIGHFGGKTARQRRQLRREWLIANDLYTVRFQKSEKSNGE